MGCWNATCFLTRLPVLHGEPIVLLLAAPRGPGYRSACHSTGQYAPVTLPLSGSYDDYGGLEDLDTGAVALKSWEALELRAMKPDWDAPRPVSLKGLVPADAEERVSAAVALADRGELECLVYDAPGKPEWRPVCVQIAKKPYWQKLAAQCAADVDGEYLRSVQFRLSVMGPLREAARCLGQVLGLKMPETPYRLPEALARDMAAVSLGMDLVRASYGPCSGGGSQDALDMPWQREWYMDMWLDAETMARRYQECPPAEFSAACAWDGNFLHMDANNGSENFVDVPDTMSDPDGAYRRILKSAAANVLDAMDEADGSDNNRGENDG